MKPLQIGNTPLKDQTIQPTWSNAYKDLGGFGLVITVTLPVVVGTSESERMVTKVANNNSVSLLGNISMLNRFYTFTSIFVWFQ